MLTYLTPIYEITSHAFRRDREDNTGMSLRGFPKKSRGNLLTTYLSNHLWIIFNTLKKVRVSY